VNDITPILIVPRQRGGEGLNRKLLESGIHNFS